MNFAIAVTGALEDDFSSLVALQVYMKRLVSLRVVYGLMQVPIVFALLGKWLVAAQAAPGFQTVPLIFSKTLGPLAEIAMLLAVVGILFVACVMSIAGPYVLRWSKPSLTAATMVEHILASAFHMR
jgi:type IV secretory pathway VirB2 component (pilin)